MTGVRIWTLSVLFGNIPIFIYFTCEQYNIIQFTSPALIDKDTHVFISFGNAVLDTVSVVYHPCALLWVPLFLPRKEEEAAEKKKQEQAAAEQKQALSCTLLQKTCHHQWRWRSNMRHPLTQKFGNSAFFLIKDIFLIIQIPSPKRGIYGFAWMLCTQIGSLTIKLGYDAPFLDKPTTPFLLGIYIFSSHTIILVGKFPNY